MPPARSDNPQRECLTCSCAVVYGASRRLLDQFDYEHRGHDLRRNDDGPPPK